MPFPLRFAELGHLAQALRDAEFIEVEGEA
jgi:hypothetical protein